jgi:AcrR family transcriptional regulator
MKDYSGFLFALSQAPTDLQKARKTPRQARSSATVETIFAATIQVLLGPGPGALTTTRVAKRAGVSVGTLYQYFPNKQALLYAVLQRHLSAFADAVDVAGRELAGAPLEKISQGLVVAFLEARTRDLDASRAIYRLADELDTEVLLTAILQRVRSAVTQLLSSAADARFSDVEAVAQMLCAALSGATRTVLERAEAGSLDVLRIELPVLCHAYLEAASRRPSQATAAAV